MSEKLDFAPQRESQQGEAMPQQCVEFSDGDESEFDDLDKPLKQDNGMLRDGDNIITAVLQRYVKFINRDEDEYDDLDKQLKQICKTTDTARIKALSLTLRIHVWTLKPPSRIPYMVLFHHWQVSNLLESIPDEDAKALCLDFLNMLRLRMHESFPKNFLFKAVGALVHLPSVKQIEEECNLAHTLSKHTTHTGTFGDIAAIWTLRLCYAHCLWDDIPANKDWPSLSMCEPMLHQKKHLFPNSVFTWYEAMIYADMRDPQEALKRLGKLQGFNICSSRGTIAMVVMDWRCMQESFSYCAESKTRVLTFYLLGAAQVELYRNSTDEGERRDLASSVTENFRSVLVSEGDSGTFHDFICSRVREWLTEAEKLGKAVVDVVGVSPAIEMACIMGVTRMMTSENAKRALEYLDQGTGGADTVVRLLKASLLRVMGEINKSKELLEKVLEDAEGLEGSMQYVRPAAQCEMAAVWNRLSDREKSLEYLIAASDCPFEFGLMRAALGIHRFGWRAAIPYL